MAGDPVEAVAVARFCCGYAVSTVPLGRVFPVYESSGDPTGSIVNVNAAEVVLSIVSVRLFLVADEVDVFPARVKVPLLLLIVTLPETVTPVGRFATAAVYEPSAMFSVVTGKVTEPAVPATMEPLCVPTVTVLTGVVSGLDGSPEPESPHVTKAIAITRAHKTPKKDRDRDRELSQRHESAKSTKTKTKTKSSHEGTKAQRARRKNKGLGFRDFLGSYQAAHLKKKLKILSCRVREDTRLRTEGRKS